MSWLFFSSPPGGPAEVRRYLHHILATNYDAGPSLAAFTAKKWQLGRFSDIHQTSRKDFENIFRTEIGKLLFRSVEEDVAREFHASPAGVFNFWATILVVTLATFFFMRAYYSRSSDRKWANFLCLPWSLVRL